MSALKKQLFSILVFFSLSFTLVGCTSWPSLFIVMLGGGGGGGGLLLIPPGGDDAPAEEGTGTGSSTDTSTGSDASNTTGTSTGTTTGTDTSTTTDPTTPVVTSVSTTTASGYYKAGNTITVTVQFDQAVTVSGTPQLTLNNDVTVDYSSGSGTDTLTFSYVVQVTDDVLGLDNKSTSALALNGGTIQGSNGSLDATLTLASPGGTGSLSSAATLNIDTIQPAKDPAVDVTSANADGTYGIGANIDITVKFTENVFVDTSGGTPRLVLNTTATTGYANYLSGTGSDTLTFRYSPSAGENSSDLDYGSTAGLELNGGTILDIAQNNAILTLPSPGASGSLANLKAIVVNTNIPSISVSSPSLAENGTNMTFVVSLSGASANTITVDYATSDVSAVAGSDYTATSGSLSFAPSETSKNVVVPITDDALDESNETFSMTLSNVNASATIGTSPGTGTITDNDATPSLSIGNASLTEGDSGSANMSFTVSLSAASGQAVSVSYASSNGTATAGSDYTAVTGTLNFAAGETSKTINVAILGDALDESNETFTVTLSSPSNASLGTSSGTGTITDNDPTPSLAVDSPSVAENVAGSTLTYTVSLSAASGQAVSVNYASSNGTATAGSDYTAVSGTLNFAVGETSKTIDVTISNDALDEDDETITMTLSSPSNASLGTAVGTGTITDEDATPSLSIDSPSAAENVAGGNLTYTVTLSAASGRTVSVNYASSDSSAIAGTDYTAVTGTLTFNAGETSKTFTVALTNDALDEVDETFTATLSSPSNATISTSSGTGTITDDDAAPSVSVANVSAAENVAGGLLTFTVSLSAASGQAITVDYASSNGTATAGSDYTAVSGTLNFAAGETSKTVDVTLSDDALDEADETFILTLTNPTNSTLASSPETATGTITDNDATPSLSIANVSAAENVAGGNLTFTVTLSSASGKSVSVNYASSDGTAVAGTDYTNTSGTLAFAAGETSKTIDVPLTNDALDEVDETLTMTLSSPSNATISTAAATGTITDEDAAPSLSIDSPSVAENVAGGNLTFTVTLSSASGKSITVDYASSDSTALAGTDYTSATGTLTFNAGETSKTIDVALTNDALDEVDETLTVTLSNASNASISTSAGTGTITDDDAEPSLSINDVTLSEGNSGTKTFDFTVTLSAASSKTITVNYATANNTATSGSDYTAIGSTGLTFSPTDLTKTFSVTVSGDQVDEGSESFYVNLSGASNASISDSQGVGTITNDDTAGVTISSVTGSTDEANSSTKATYTVVLNTQPTGNVVVTVGTDSQNTVDSGSLTFTTGNWNVAQTVTVTAANDDIDEASPHTGTITHSINTGSTADSIYDAITGIASASINVSDNDTAGVTISSVTGSTDEANAGTQATYTVVLNTEPTGNVVVTVAPDSQTTVDSGSLTFTTGNWNVAQTVTVTAVNDDLDEIATHTSSITHSINTGSTADSNYDAVTGINPSSINVSDNDTAGVTISSVTGSTDEANAGTQATYTVVLNTEPTGNVVVTVATDSQNTIDKSSLTFTTGNWNVAQTITATAVNDDVDEASPHTGTITHSINTGSTADSTYDAVSGIASASINVSDNDTAGVTISSVTGSTDEANAGTQATYTVVLDSEPTGNVVVTVATDSQNTVDKSSLTFTTGNWNVAQTITVTAANDDIDEAATHTGTITHSINTGSTADSTYDAVSGIASASIGVSDNDTAGVTISSITGSTDEANTGTNATYTVVLATEPTGNVVVTVTTDSQNTIDKSSLTFTTGNWNVAQTITATAVNDDVDEAATHTGTITHSINTGSTADSNYDAVTGIASASINVSDNDTAGVTISSVTGSTDEANSSTKATYTVVLNSQPTGNVVVTVAPDSQNTVDSGSLTFTTANWDTAQTVTVTAVNDDVDEAATHTGTITHTINTGSTADSTYDAVTGIASASINVSDNDTAGVTISSVTGSTDEGNSSTKATYTVVLNTEPTGNVVVTVAPDAQNTVDSGSLTFTTGNWNSAQTVTVTAVNDDLDEASPHTGTITHSINTGSTADSTYDAVTGIASASINVTDNDTAGVTITQSGGSTDVTEGGATDTYTVVLDSQPTASVTISFGTNADVSSISDITFTTGNWNVAQTITVTAVDDAVYEGAQTSTISHSASSSDGGYSGISISSVTANVTDNESAPNITINNASVTEGNSGTTTATFTVTLSVATEAGVTVDYATADNTATTADSDYTGISTTTLNIAALATSNTLTVDVTGDAKDEVDESYYVNLSNASVGTITDSQGEGTITNDDSPPTVQFASASSSSGDETATNRTVSLSLSTASSKTITVQVTDAGSGSATSGTDYTAIGSPVTVTFNAGSTSETVTIPVLQDLLFEGDETIALTLGSPSNASLGSQTSHTFTITDDEIGISSAETMDADNDGRIDHYKLTFSEAINDSTFPGYSLNAVGSSQSKWLVAGYSGVVLAHGSAAPESDTANDSVIYLQFTEGSSTDTAVKPDLTTTTAPDLTAVSGKTVGQVFTATVTEADKARPVIISATGDTVSANLTVTFSEPVYGATGALACGSGGNLGTTTVTYSDASSGDAGSISSMGADTCGTDNIAIYVANTNFTSSDNGTDTIAASANIYDAADNTGNTTAVTLTITLGPSISQIEQYDTDADGKIDQLKVTFSGNIQDSSITDTDAAQFTLGGTALTQVDSVAGGTGTIASPNDDSGTTNDTVVTVFSDDFTISGTDKKAMAFTTASGKWLGSGIEVQTVADLSSVVVDKAPPVILTAVAAENATAGAGIDSDDTLVLTFSEGTNKPTINDGNISSIFSLSSSHTWGTITSAAWNTAGDELTITFAGSGSPTITVGDYITILGTITDTATSPNTSTNLQSVSPITGTFEVSVPVVTTVSSMDPTTVRVTFSEPVNNSEATTVGNYKIADSASSSGLCSDNTNFTGSTSSLSISAATKVDDYTYDLTTATQVNNNSYVLLVDKSNVNHRDYSTYSVSCPNNGNFLGQEKLKVSSVTCGSLMTVVATFSKPVKTGVNVANSAECDNTTECAKRYAIKGTVSGTEVGDISSVRVLDGTVCGGLTANSNKVCITHNLNQNGSIYTLLAANNTDGDGFDDTSFGALQDSSGTETLLASPKDRGAFQGCGTVPQNFIDGPVISDPFGDGTAFGYLEKYNNKIYIGPNQNGNGATRFNADGSSPENLTFEILKDTTGSRQSDSTAGAPFESIGASGCTRNNSGNSGCGPNNENGRGNFTVGTFGGVEYLFISGTKVYESGITESNRNNDYLYYTTDSDTVLNFNYIDASWGFDNRNTCNGSWSSSVIWNSVSESIHVFNEVIYWSVPGTGTNRPFLTRIHTIPSDGEVDCGTHGQYMNMRYMPGVGRIAVGGKTATPDNLGGLFDSFNDRIYFMNSGSITFNSSTCKQGDTYSAGVCEQDGGIVRSTNNSPVDCTDAGCTDWTDITPSSTDFRKYFTIALPSDDAAMTDLIPAQKPMPSSAEFQGKFYFVRNACTEVLWNDSCGFGSNCSDDPLCPAGSEIPQLWKCDPASTGNATECDSADWTLVAQNGSTGKTNFGDGNNTHITMVAENGDYLYVGFDNPTTGIEVWRTNTADPSVEGDFSQIGGDGFGSGTAITEIYDQVSLGSGSIHYLYLSIGKNNVPVKVHRQQNTGPVVSLEIKDLLQPNTLLAYASNSTGIPREYFYLFFTLFVLTSAILFYRLRMRLQQKKV